MATSLTFIGIFWAVLSLVDAIAACIGFYLPFWIKGSLFNRTDTYFGVFRRCNYVDVSPDTGVVSVVEECGRYNSFSDIPSVSWQISAILVGSGCGLALLVAFIAILACCMTDVLNKPTAKGCGILQLIAALLIFVGCAIYPNGWHSREVREACGGKSEAFHLGTCTISWSFYILGSAVFVLLINVCLAFKASRVKGGSYRIKSDSPQSCFKLIDTIGFSFLVSHY
ncbi:hypothetical protein CHUAL_002502 [Chamberlinius hualienensis]